MDLVSCVINRACITKCSCNAYVTVSINTARAVLILTEGPVSIDAARAVLMLTGKPVSINTDRFARAVLILPTFSL